MFYRGFLSFSFLSCFYGCPLSVSIFFLITMTIRVNDTIHKSRNPLEYGVVINECKGKVIQKLSDGYWLIEFGMKVTVKGKKKTWLQWYIHETDLTVIK